MKPIEPGCLALVINDPEAGITVTCVEFKAAGFRFKSSSDGEDYKSLEPAWITDDPDGKRSIRPTRTLLRIDGGAESEERIAERKDMEVPA